VKETTLIGIVGGTGPLAGFDCAEKIIDQTIAEKDQDHIPLAILSFPHFIKDRTDFLLHRENKNPAYAIVDVIVQLEKIGATVVGIPCNTAHAPPIFTVINEELKKRSISITLINMIDETMEFIKSYFPNARSIGVLATRGTYDSGIYSQALQQRGYKIIYPDNQGRMKIHQAIYDKKRGIKAQSIQITQWAAQRISKCIDYFYSLKVDCVILGCTEIPLAVPLITSKSVCLIDPTLILARALIRETYPQKLKEIKI